MIKIHLKTSKCDQLGEGVDIFVGTTGSPICPVAATIEYIRTRQDAPGAFFVDKNRKPVGKAWFTQQIVRFFVHWAYHRTTMLGIASA